MRGETEEGQASCACCPHASAHCTGTPATWVGTLGQQSRGAAIQVLGTALGRAPRPPTVVPRIPPELRSLSKLNPSEMYRRLWVFEPSVSDRGCTAVRTSRDPGTKGARFETPSLESASADRTGWHDGLLA